MNTIPKIDNILDQIHAYGLSVGRTGASMALSLYYVMISPTTSFTSKAIIAGALAYQFLPRQIFSRERHGVIGVVDNVITLTIAYDRYQNAMTPEITSLVESKLKEWGL